MDIHLKKTREELKMGGLEKTKEFTGRKYNPDKHQYEYYIFDELVATANAEIFDNCCCVEKEEKLHDEIWDKVFSKRWGHAN